MNNEFIKYLVCPECKGRLQALADSGLSCEPCDRLYPYVNGMPDFRPDAVSEGESDGVEDANRIYHDAHADTYEQDRHTTHMFEAKCQARLKEITGYLAKESGNGQALDVGAGTGNALKYLAESFDITVGADISEAMLGQVPECRAELILASALKLPFEEGFFNAVTAFSVLHHLYNPMDGIMEAFRVLKPGGMFYSDWDFNRFFRTRLFFSMYIHKLNPISAAKGFIDHFLMKDEENEIFTRAEYHAFKDWLDGEALKSDMEKLGFSDVKLIYHWNESSILDTTGTPCTPPAKFTKSLITLSRNPMVQNPIFIILARK